MHGSLFFVHGTGVRQSGHDATLAAIRDGVQRNGMGGIDVVGCPWGETLGVKLDHVAETLPPAAQTRDITSAPPTAAEIATATWALLIDDPLFELRLAAQA